MRGQSGPREKLVATQTCGARRAGNAGTLPPRPSVCNFQPPKTCNSLRDIDTHPTVLMSCLENRVTELDS